MGALIARNLKVFFRDRTAVVMSFFSDFVMIALYAMFLRDQLLNIGFDGADRIVDTWIIAGIIAVTSMTTTLGGLATMVDDRVSGVQRDFLVTPIRRSALAGAYALASFMIGALLTLCTFVLGEVFVVAQGGTALNAADTVIAGAGILLSVASSGAIVFFITSLLRSTTAYSMTSLIVGVSIGFLTGAYIPIGTLSESMQYVVKLFPVSYASSFFRFVLTDAPLRDLMDSGAPVSLIEDIRRELGIFYDFDGVHTTTATAVWVMAATAVVFFLLAWWGFNVKRKSVA